MHRWLLLLLRCWQEQLTSMTGAGAEHGNEGHAVSSPGRGTKGAELLCACGAAHLCLP